MHDLKNDINSQNTPPSSSLFVFFLIPVLFLKKGIWKHNAFQGGKVIGVGSLNVLAAPVISGDLDKTWCPKKSSSAVEVSETNTSPAESTGEAAEVSETNTSPADSTGEAVTNG